MTENQPPAAPPLPEEPKQVWIACRAKESCEGNQAVIEFSRSHQPLNGKGGFNAQVGGRATRYKCLTCGGAFHINT